jgi:hypothetical protein
MKIDIRKKHLYKNLLIKQIFSSYIVTFLIIASFSLLVLSTYNNIADAKTLFTTSDSSIDSDDTKTVGITLASSKANENSAIVTDSTTSDSSDDSDDTKTVGITLASSKANENSAIVTDNNITDEDSNEDDKDKSDFWNWIANYDEDDDDLNSYEDNYSEESESNDKTESGILSKLKNKQQDNKYYFIVNFLIHKFEKYL